MRPLILIFFATLAHAADIPCPTAEKGAVRLDGLTDDWSDLEGIDAGGRDPNLSFTLKCSVDSKALYLLVDVRDNYFVRTKDGRPGEDHVELTFAGKKLVVYPGDAASIKDKVVWPGGGASVASALQENGWAVEIALPIRSVPGMPGAPQVKYSARVSDCDSKTTLKTERFVETVGMLAFTEGTAALQSFFENTKLRQSDVFFDRPLRVGRGQAGRVLLAGRYLAIITDAYVYVELPFRSRSDLKDTRIVDLAGDGRDAVVMRYVERGGGAREVLAVYRLSGDMQVARVFAHEIAKSQGSSRVEDKVSFVKRGRATDIVIEPGTSSGFTEANYQEAPAEDMLPIILPWAPKEDRKARYQFSGDEYRRAQ